MGLEFSLGRTIDRLFSIKKEKFYLLSILVFGFFLRLIAAINLRVYADDMHHVIHAINFLSSGRLVTYDQSAGLWHAFTSIMYNLFGLTQLSSRLASLIFGSLSILLVYFLSKEFFDERTSLIAAFLLAISPFQIKSTVAEMDIMAMFFVMFSMLLFIRALKSNNSLKFAISGLFLGLAIYTKVYPILFIPSLLLYAIYFNKKEKKKIISKSNAKKLFIFLLAIFIFAIPALAHNYLLYQDKGFLDLQFTRTLNLGKDKSEQFYGWDHQFNAKNDWRGLIFGNSTNSGLTTPTLLIAIDYLRLGSPVVFYLGLLGIFTILWRRAREKRYLIFFLLNILFALSFLASIILLPKHFIFLELLLIPISALFICELGRTNKISRAILIALFILSLVLLGSLNVPQFYFSESNIYVKNIAGQMIDFKDKEIPKDALIIEDSRIYRGTIHWTSQNRPYLEGTDFIQFLNQQSQLPGSTRSIEVYYFECAIDDCGWGTVKDQPEFNQSMEVLTDSFKKQGQLVKTISDITHGNVYYPIFKSGNKIDVINIYKVNAALNENILRIASSPKNWFLYDIGYEPKEKQFDYYQTYGFFNKSLDKMAHLIVWLAIILTFLSIGCLFYILIKNETLNNNSSL